MASLSCNAQSVDELQIKVKKLEALGGTACESAPEAAEKADVFITMVPRSEHSRAVYESILPALHAGKICIDMSTIDPGVSVEIAGKVLRHDLESDEAQMALVNKIMEEDAMLN